jgi:TIGR03009 family protein
MLTTRVLHSALLLGFASASLVSSQGAFIDGAFAQGDFAPVGQNAASGVDAGIDPLRSGVPAGPAVDPRLPPAQIPGAGPGAFGPNAPGQGMPQQLPQPFPPQTEKELAYIEQLLTFWEQQSGKIQRYRTEFSRWVTDPVFGPAETFKTFSKGEIRYESPDKGLFRVDMTGQWTPPAQAGGKPSYPDMGDAGKEQWICDGKSLFEFNYAQKKLVERKLPPEMHGKAIADGPLPFVFGAKKETIQSRYWLRVTTNKEAQEKGEYWLEAYPKSRDDAVNYTKIEIIIAGADFLPSAIKIYERNNVETIYQFTNRSSNWNFDLEKVGLWRSAFNPATPAGWERLVEPAPGEQAAAPLAAGPGNPNR